MTTRAIICSYCPCRIVCITSPTTTRMTVVVMWVMVHIVMWAVVHIVADVVAGVAMNILLGVESGVVKMRSIFAAAFTIGVYVTSTRRSGRELSTPPHTPPTHDARNCANDEYHDTRHSARNCNGDHER